MIFLSDSSFEEKLKEINERNKIYNYIQRYAKITLKLIYCR